MQRGLLGPTKIDQRDNADLAANQKFVRKNAVLDRVMGFFCEPDWPINLAVFRIAVFSAVLYSQDFYEAIWFASLPAVLQHPPPGPLALMNLVPLSPSLVEATSVLLMVACIGGIVGFRARTCALLVAILGTYVMGVPQFFFKVDHTSHHLVWFAMILAFSRCGDALSIEAFIRSKRKPSANKLPPVPSMIYGLPLRITWLLMGIIYFFPGFWKLKTSGLAWVFSDNLQNTIYKRMTLNAESWSPVFRVDQFPGLCQSGALATLVFELSFIVLIFSPLGRLFLVVAGQFFHCMTIAFLHISFLCLQSCYVALVDWHAVGQGLKKLMRKRKSGGGLKTSLHAAGDRKTSHAIKLSKEDWSNCRSAIVPLCLVGIFLVCINASYGFRKDANAWPFSCYPLFDGVMTKTCHRFVLEGYDAEGKKIELAHPTAIFRSRWTDLASFAGNQKDELKKQQCLAALWQAVCSDNINVADAHKVSLYLDELTVVPEQWTKNPVSRKLMSEIVLNSDNR